MRYLLGLGALLLTAICVAGASAASAAGGSDATIKALEVRTSVDQVDVGPAGLSPGDEFILGGRLRNLADTTTIGRARDVCTVLATGGSNLPLHCVTVVWLSGGTLELAGFASGGPFFRLAITGGTGAYDTAHGQLAAKPGPNNTTLLTFDID